jgi:medium-chain acyl-[acyl-carrier-protein] hydrolase
MQPVSQIETIAKPTSSPWLIRTRARRPAKVCLVGFPHAGGGASSFRRLCHGLPAEVEGIGIQLPGRESRMREPLIGNLEHLVNELSDNLAPALEYEIPFVFFGHSLGALLAFEVSRRFRAKRLRPPAALVVSGRTPPHLPLVRRAMHPLPDEDLLQEVVKLGGMPQQILANRELLRFILPVLRADLKMDETYVYSPEPPFNCPVLACGGRNDPEVSPSQLLEWRNHTRSEFVLKAFAGEHFFMYTSPSLFTSQLSMFLLKVAQVTA